MFTLELLQAISDWQRGGDTKQKLKRGNALKEVAKKLPNKYKSISNECYRQIALDGSSIWNIGTQYKLRETISSWTTSLEIAKKFKGGVPPIGYQGAIFKVSPINNLEVIINLNELFNCIDFKEFLELNKRKIRDYDKGTERYGNSQQELVISVEYLNLDSLFAWGGYSGSENQLAELYFGHPANNQEIELFQDLMRLAGLECGPYWLTNKEAVMRVSEKLKYHAERLL